MPHRMLVPLAAAATGVQVGAAIVATRFLAGQVSPASLALLRYLIALGCLLPAMLLLPRTAFARRDMLPIGLLGIGQFGVLIALMNYGLQFIPAARGALIFATMPLLTMLLAAGLGHERLSWLRSLGVLLTIAGAGCALGIQAIQGGQAADPWQGDAALAASALCGALCSVLYRPYLRKYPALSVSTLAMLAAVGFLALLAAAEGSLSAPPQLSTAGWMAVGFIGVGSGAGYWLWLWALRHASATQVAVFLALSPLSAVGLGAALLGEPVVPGALIGCALVTAGLWFANRTTAAAATRPAPGQAPCAPDLQRPSTPERASGQGGRPAE
jgi:drug/metabolite transporter (DMT)-like permease